MHHGYHPGAHSQAFEKFRVESRKVGAVRHQEDSTARQQQAGAARRRDSARLLKRKTTLAAIAAEAGVSLPTVSKVVNGRPDVAPATRARVERLLGEFDYHRPGVRGVRRGRRSGLVDLIFNRLDSPWA